MGAGRGRGRCTGSQVVDGWHPLRLHNRPGRQNPEHPFIKILMILNENKSLMALQWRFNEHVLMDILMKTCSVCYMKACSCVYKTRAAMPQTPATLPPKAQSAAQQSPRRPSAKRPAAASMGCAASRICGADNGRPAAMPLRRAPQAGMTAMFRGAQHHMAATFREVKLYYYYEYL